MPITYKKFLGKNIDISPLGCDTHRERVAYFCTPKRASIIGYAGVDGIHFCFIGGFGETVFAVSPENTYPNYVHPIAANFEELLRLLLACRDLSALEQAWQWDEKAFYKFVRDIPTTAEQKNALSEIEEKTGLTPMEEPYKYLKALRENFDYSKIKYTDDVFDSDMNKNAPLPDWKVSFGQGFGAVKGHSGKEVALGIHFDFAEHEFIIPSMYICGKGLVLDICMRIDPYEIEFLNAKYPQDELTEDKMMLRDAEHPLTFDYSAEIELNGVSISENCGYGLHFDSNHSDDIESSSVISHYELDTYYNWLVRRISFPWSSSRAPKIKTLDIKLTPEKVQIPGETFTVTSKGQHFDFEYNGVSHRLDVTELQTHTIGMRKSEEYPSNGLLMTYTVTPPLPNLILKDITPADRPKPKKELDFVSVMTVPIPQNTAVRGSNDTDILSIIGGSDGPTAVLIHSPSEEKAVVSSLHFEPITYVTWKMIFSETRFESVTVPLNTNIASLY